MWCSVEGSFADKAKKVYEKLNHRFQSDGYEIIENLFRKHLITYSKNLLKCVINAIE